MWGFKTIHVDPLTVLGVGRAAPSRGSQKEPVPFVQLLEAPAPLGSQPLSRITLTPLRLHYSFSDSDPPAFLLYGLCGYH